MWIIEISFCRDCRNYKCILDMVPDKRSRWGRKMECRNCATIRARSYRRYPWQKRKQETLKQAPYLAMARLVKENHHCFVAAANTDIILYKRLLKEEQDKIEAVYELKKQRLVGRRKEKVA